MKRHLLLLIAAVTMLAAPAPARAVDAARLAGAQRLLDRNLFAPKPDGLIKARAEFEALAKAEPKSAALHYWVALADWRLVPRLEDAKPAERFCRDGLEHADQALRLDPGFAEALAIKSGLQGLSLRFDPNAMMTLGAELEANMRRALELAPANPRIHLMDAINTLHKPDFVGGGAERAMPKFQKTLELYAAAAPADSTAPAWGHEDALIWAGRAAAALHDTAGARDYYERALEVNPRNDWVRHSLAPALAAPDSGATAKGKP